MRSDKKSKKNTKFNKFTKGWSIVYLLAIVAFIGFLIYANLLSTKYMLIAGGVVVLLTLITFPALYFRNFKKSRKIICLVLSILLMAGYGLGTFYLTGTLDFFSRITDVGVQTEDYYVLVKSDSTHKEIDELKGKTIQTYLTNDFTYSEAKNQLQDEQKVEYEMIENLSALADGLSDDSYDSIFISAAHYNLACEEHETFRDDSKILYTVKVKTKTKDISKDVDVTKESFNVYISGLDVEGTIDVTSRSDVNMIATVNPATHTVMLTSIPRDYLINLSSKENATDKLTHTGIYGINETVGAVEKLMGIDINYYVKVNYTTVTKFVDAIGGIEVDSDFAFTTHGQSVYFNYNEGINYLDGAHALAFARERKSFTDGDVQRNKNQQKIVAAILKKTTTSTTLLTKYSSILNSIEDNVELNMTAGDIKLLVKMQLDDMAGWKVKSQNVHGEGDMAVCYSTGDYLVSVMNPDQESIIKAVDKIVAVMDGGKK